jgi:hypothetical protein
MAAKVDQKKGPLPKEPVQTEPEPLQEIPIPEDLTTTEDLIRRNNFELVQLKKENRELRGQLRTLNTRLTGVIEAMRSRKVEKGAESDRKSSKLEVLDRELQNAEDQIAAYKREIGFLQNRVKEGDKIDQIKQLDEENSQLIAKEAALEAQLSALKNQEIVLGNLAKKLAMPETHKSKVAAMIEKRKAMGMKYKKLTGESEKIATSIKEQKAFADSMNERYLTLCKEVGQEPQIKLVFGEDGEAKTILVGPQPPQSFRVKTANVSLLRAAPNVAESWAMDNPDSYRPPANDEEFKRLKEKVLGLRHSLKVDVRKSSIVGKKNNNVAKLADREINSLGIILLLQR